MCGTAGFIDPLLSTEEARVLPSGQRRLVLPQPLTRHLDEPVTVDYLCIKDLVISNSPAEFEGFKDGESAGPITLCPFRGHAERRRKFVPS
jgi:hypothetical protein